MATPAQKIASCSACAGHQYLVDRRADRAQAKVCACVSGCSRCEGAGRTYETRDGYTYARTCGCRTVQARVARFNAARIPAVLAGRGFDEYDPASEVQERAKKLCEDLTRTYRQDRPPRGLLLSGPVGTGKTHLLCASLGYLTLELGVSSRYVEISFLYSEIREGFREGRSGLDAVMPLVETEVLAIDELGKGRGSAFELDTLDELIARRYNAGRTTLFATNFSLAESRKGRSASGGYIDVSREAAEGKGEQLLRDRVGERIYSRLHEMCDWVEFPGDGPDQDRRKGEWTKRNPALKV